MPRCNSFCQNTFKDVDILNKTLSGRDSEGYEIYTWSVDETIKADFQPISGEILEKEYGITDREIKYRLFIFVPTVIENGSKLLVDSKLYEARSVLDWGAHVECVLKPYLGDITIT